MHRSAAAVMISMAVTACTTVGSFHSAVGEDAVVGEDRLLGEWVAVGEEADTVHATVTRLSQSHYQVTLVGEEQQSSTYEGYLVPLGGRLLLELSPGAADRDVIEEHGGIFTYTHLVVEFGDATVRTAAFDGDALLKALQRDVAPQLEYVIREIKDNEYASTNLLLTSAPAALRAGLEHYSRDPKVLDDWDTWRRPQANAPAGAGP